MIAMMLTDYNSGRWQCARTGSRRERESQKVKRGAGEDPRTKSKLKVSVFSFFPRVFVKYVEAGCFEGFVARRLFGRLVALPALISKSATVSNFPFWPTAPTAPAPATQKRGKGNVFALAPNYIFLESEYQNKLFLSPV